VVGGERAIPRNVRPDLPLVVDVVGQSDVRATLLNAQAEGEISPRDLRRHQVLPIAVNSQFAA